MRRETKTGASRHFSKIPKIPKRRVIFFKIPKENKDDRPTGLLNWPMVHLCHLWSYGQNCNVDLVRRFFDGRMFQPIRGQYSVDRRKN